jgi:hypothetical protein
MSPAEATVSDRSSSVGAAGAERLKSRRHQVEDLNDLQVATHQGPVEGLEEESFKEGEKRRSSDQETPVDTSGRVLLKCKFCNKEFADILKHLKKSEACTKVYDIDALVTERKMARMEKKRMYMKLYENKNKVKILEGKKEHYEKNRDLIRKQMSSYYKKSRAQVCQRQRFRKHVVPKDTLSYLTEQQEHLYHHTNGFCQPETMKYLNHSVEHYDGVCESCKIKEAIKIVGVNRQVCLSCKKAHCTICKVEVSPNPLLGYHHYSPDTGQLLNFIPGCCPLYSIYFFPDFAATNFRDNRQECKMCDEIKTSYPEYETFCEEITERRQVRNNCFEAVNVNVYTCNLCDTRTDFVCEFDHHMRCHSKYGPLIAIVALKTKVQEENKNNHVKYEDFASFEKEFMKAEGVSAVLAVFSKRQMKDYFAEKDLESVDLGASLLLKSCTDIQAEFGSIAFDQDIIGNCEILMVRNHCMQEFGHTGEKERFEELLLWQDHFTFPCDPRPKTKFHARNRALLTSRCALAYPSDRYQSVIEHSHLQRPGDLLSYQSQVLRHLWKIVKCSSLCCCESKFYCSTSTDLEKCREGCCDKCKQEDQEESSASDTPSADFESSTETDLDSELGSESKSSSEYSGDGGEFC